MAKKSKAAKADKSGATLLRSAEIGARQESFSHPWNPNSELIGVQLGKKLGLKRVGVSIVRVPPGKESFVPHAHAREEEWVYILMGQAMALFGEEETEVGAGDFLAYPAPQVTHHLRNTGDVDLVYLMGGEIAKLEIVEFPTLGKRTVRVGDEVTVYDTATGAAETAPQAAPVKAKAEKTKKSKKKSKKA